MLLKFSKDLSFRHCEAEKYYTLLPVFLQVERFGNIYSTTDCESLQRQIFVGLTVTRLPGRLLEIAFSPFSLCALTAASTQNFSLDVF